MMTLMYLMVAGVVGLIFFGPVGAVLGGVIGILYGSTQANYRRIIKLEEAIKELKSIKDNKGEL